MAEIDFTFTDDSDESDDLQIFDEVDLADDTTLRQVILEIESFLQQKKSLRISVLDAVQWDKALNRYYRLLPQARRAQRNVHILPDPQDPHHLMISPSAVQGINEGGQVFYTELVYHVLRSLPAPALSKALRRGLDGLFSEILAKKLGVPLRYAASRAEIEMIKGIVLVLSQEFGWHALDWARLMRRDPDKFFLAMRKSKFLSELLAQAKEHPLVEPEIRDASNKRQALIEIMRSETFSAEGALGTMMRDLARQKATAKTTRKKKESTPK